MIRKMKPNSAKNAKVTAPLAAVKRRLRNRRTSSIGCAVRCSVRTRAARATTATAAPASVRVLPQPALGASMMV